jgi:hypothetical protein
MQTRTATQRLLHRWFVEYNPFYLLSAVLVLFGVTLISRALANESSVRGHLVVGAVTELYAYALVFGAALLTRIELRRPAVFVALIAILYQGDLTLGTEAHALFGRLGAVASSAWFVSFAVKLHGLAWALKLRLSGSAKAVPLFGAAGLALVPHLSRHLDAHTLTLVVGVWLFAVLAAGLWTSREVASRMPLDAWGSAVLRRSMRAAWSVWAALAIAHVFFWTSQYHLDPRFLAPITLLLATRWMQRELEVLAAVCVTLLFVAVVAPALLAVSAVTSAMAFTLHALRTPRVQEDPAPDAPDVYRGAHVDATSPVEVVFAPAPPPRWLVTSRGPRTRCTCSYGPSRGRAARGPRTRSRSTCSCPPSSPCSYGGLASGSSPCL